MPGFDLSPAGLVAGFVVSTLGLAVFVYGKKAVRVPQLAGGLLMMVLPCVVSGAALIWAIGGALVAAIWIAVRFGL